MASPTGFIEYHRCDLPHRPIAERIKDWHEIDMPLVAKTLTEQAARCMDCGVPFCHATGCPVKNRIPEFNELVYQGRWHEAAANLHSTNNFPEVTGRVCPAPCEAACTLTINDEAVNIKHIELQIAERAFHEGWVRPIKPAYRTGKKVAVIGSGPAGLAVAQQLARGGHEVVVYEKDDRIGGLLRYGIPDFKLDKRVIDRRLEQMVAEGVKFEPGVTVGQDISTRYLRKTFDAICLCMGAGEPRRLVAQGAGYEGVHTAMEFLTQQNRRNAGDQIPQQAALSARDKHVVVIGGGDTGSDCVGTSIRQGARSVTQLEILPKPPQSKRNPETPWPTWPKIMRTSSSHEEGCERRWSTLTKQLSGSGVQVSELHCVEVDWIRADRGWEMRERAGSEFTLKADLVLLAMGFVHVVHEGLVEEFGLELDGRGNVRVKGFMASEEGIFAAGDTVRGASLVVHAINEGRLAAAAIDQWLKVRV